MTFYLIYCYYAFPFKKVMSDLYNHAIVKPSKTFIPFVEQVLSSFLGSLSVALGKLAAMQTAAIDCPPLAVIAGP